MRRLVFVVFLTLGTGLHAAERPKNIILFIGDGMGPAHFTYIRTLRESSFRIGALPVVGLVFTAAADRPVTDSAAAASALATGGKANYEAVSVDPSGKPVETVLEVAEKRGKATGLVTTTGFWDATPAAFAAHSAHRRNAVPIVTEMVSKGIEVIAGGGLEKFGRDGIPPAADFAARAGYTLVDEPRELSAARGERILVVLPTAKRDADLQGMPLPALTGWAIERLMNDPAGFFLMVEHEGTDTGSHWNDNEVVRASLTSFDEAVGVALDFAKGRDDTLIVVTSDHETGGLRLSQSEGKNLRLEWSTTDHTAVVVPLFATGPGAEEFGGLQDNTDVGKKLIEAVK